MIARAGQLVTFDGALFQATKDTARRPGAGHQDWTLVARGGKDGQDGKSIVYRGGFNARDAYAAGDLVSFEGETFIAVCDSPTGIASDGEGWALFAARGVKGERGLTGLRGHRGDKGAAEPRVTIAHWRVYKEAYKAVP